MWPTIRWQPACPTVRQTRNRYRLPVTDAVTREPRPPASDDVWRVVALAGGARGAPRSLRRLALDAAQTLNDRADRRRFPRSVMASRVTRHRRVADILATAYAAKAIRCTDGVSSQPHCFPWPRRRRRLLQGRARRSSAGSGPSDPNWPSAGRWEALNNDAAMRVVGKSLPKRLHSASVIMKR